MVLDCIYSKKLWVVNVWGNSYGKKESYVEEPLKRSICMPKVF